MTTARSNMAHGNIRMMNTGGASVNYGKYIPHQFTGPQTLAYGKAERAPRNYAPDLQRLLNLLSDIVIGDSGATDTVVSDFAGKTGENILDTGMLSADITFNTANSNDAPMQPLGVGKMTLLFIDNLSRIWIVTLEKTYIFISQSIQHMLLSPGAIDRARQDTGDTTLLCCGTPSLSHLQLNTGKHSTGRIECSTIRDTYFLRVLPIEALAYYINPSGKSNADAIIGDTTYCKEVLQMKHIVNSDGSQLVSLQTLADTIYADFKTT